MVPDDGGVPCDYCAAQRALVHCAQHGTRLCLLCDVPVHAATAGAHKRAPLCEGCHAAPAAARCAVHRASLCAHCARAAGCDAERHDRCPAQSYTGFPDPADLARILYIDAPLPAEVPPPSPPLPQEPPDTWVPNLVNVELHQAADLPGSSSRSLDERTVMTNELPSSSSLIHTGGNFEKQAQAVTGDGSAAAAAALPTTGVGGEGDAGPFRQDYSDWYNHLSDDPDGAGGVLDDSNFIHDWNWSLTEPLVLNDDEPEAAWWSSSSGYPWPLNPSSSYSSETVVRPSTDHAMESLAGNNAAFRLSSSVMSTAANTSSSTTPYQLDLLAPVHQLHLHQGETPNPDWLLLPPHQLPECKFFNSGLPMWPPDEFPSRHLGIDEHLTPAALGSTTVIHQNQDTPLQQQQQQQRPVSSTPMPVPVLEQGSSQDMEAKTKLQEKREEAKQRYKDKKKNRRFGKQIMYVSRKVRADTRKRVKGRFAKASSGSGGQGDVDQSTQHGHGNGGDEDDRPTHS